MKNSFNSLAATKKSLLVLPCNPGAKEGNYFPYGAWKQCFHLLKKNRIDKSFIDFAAIDSIITLMDPAHDKEQKGAIVLETEMDRVKGCDLKPSWEIFRQNQYALLEEHTKYCQIGFCRLLSLYNLIVVAISVRGYKYAAIRALRNLGVENIPQNVIVIDAGESTGFQNNACSMAIQIIDTYLTNQTQKVPFGQIIIPEQLKLHPNFLKRPDDLPAKFRYWE